MKTFAQVAFEKGGSIHPLIIDPKLTGGLGLMNPSIYNDNGKLIVNLRSVNYTFYHSEEKLFQHPYGPLTYVHPENDLHLRTWNYYLELNDDYIITTSWEKRYDMDKLRTLWEECYSFIVHGSCVTPNVRQLIEEVEEDHNVDAQSHIYMGKCGSRSFSIHSDNPDNLIVQCIGKSKVTVYNEYSDVAGNFPNADVSIKEQVILEPGNSIYIPSLQYHLFEPLTDRLSISIPMYKKT